MRAILKLALLIVVGLVALWLLNDALTFALYAPSAERAGGCYTTIELWIAATQPDDRIRQAELFSGLGLLLTAVGWSVFGAFRWVRTSAIGRSRLDEPDDAA
jgi:hypothetical protein